MMYRIRWHNQTSSFECKEAMKPPNSRKIVLRYNRNLQPIGAEAGILSDILGLLGSDYTKFPICEKDWRKVRSKDKIYNECVKEMFYFDEDNGRIIKRTILKMLGRAWKETRNRLYHDHYDSQLTIEQNIEGRPPWITADHWRWYLDYRNSEDTKEKCRENTVNRSKQLYTHTSRSKSLGRLGEEEEIIAEIEQHDESSRLLSQNDSLAQALEKEHSGRVHGMGIRLTSSQVFGTNSHQSSNGAQREETQRVLLELQAELATEKLKRKVVRMK
ncbi:uncharacterized protein [Arachis hypogaea]|uniref:Uncharacterized protein n=1 Tax=Arachis hypogaea TaxID=3818 RepID=A0A444X741_ARAHY|nr:uncharacterized protein LOC112784639 [Arachis hypogaea]XP_025683709.1 uncharacterized protein LOC112784639 [Arachis hypogaea]XP_025683710.1 uncharacterized protein LOC112784639 [Arachis hypogaea]RYQ85520.1 hypothetical protein Ahy_B10g105089 [Arachis hypogaea]